MVGHNFINILQHLEKWGCHDFRTKAAVIDLLKLLGHEIKDQKVKKPE